MNKLKKYLKPVVNTDKLARKYLKKIDKMVPEGSNIVIPMEDGSEVTITKHKHLHVSSSAGDVTLVVCASRIVQLDRFITIAEELLL